MSLDSECPWIEDVSGIEGELLVSWAERRRTFSREDGAREGVGATRDERAEGVNWEEIGIVEERWPAVKRDDPEGSRNESVSEWENPE